MFFILVVAIVGGVSAAAARAIRRPAENKHGSSSPSNQTAKSTLTMAVITVAVFLPLFLGTYIAVGLVGHALGQ